MDPATLAAAVTGLMTPYLAKAGGVMLDHLITTPPDAIINLWGTITKHFDAKPAAAAAITELVHDASDKDQQAAFALQLKMALKNDPEFAAAIEDLTKKAGGLQPGTQNVTIGNVTGSAITFGNNNNTDVKSSN